jgi:hypothetical protein
VVAELDDVGEVEREAARVIRRHDDLGTSAEVVVRAATSALVAGKQVMGEARR